MLITPQILVPFFETGSILSGKFIMIIIKIEEKYIYIYTISFWTVAIVTKPL